jgi:hypothetical protein
LFTTVVLGIFGGVTPDPVVAALLEAVVLVLDGGGGGVSAAGNSGSVAADTGVG